MKSLVMRAQNHDRDAFAELISLYRQDMYRVAKSYLRNDQDAADAIGETVLACFEKLSSLREPEHFKTWLIRILINRCNDLINADKRYVSMDDIPEAGQNDAAQSNMEFMMLMDSLDEWYRTALVLRYGEGFSVREISDLLGITESAVKARLKRGRDKMKKFYGEYKAEVLI